MTDAIARRQQAGLDLLRAARILPIVTADDAEQAVAVARALQAGGLGTIELTLRTPAALAAIAAIKRALPSVVVGAGTVLDAAQLGAAEAAGADFIVTPGVSRTMLDVLAGCALPVVPGAATPSELLDLRERGFRLAKLFPASAVGGIALLKALQGPLPDLMFCPTGGIGENDAADYLALGNVACVGGSWMVPRDSLQAGDWDAIRACAERARALADGVRR